MWVAVVSSFHSSKPKAHYLTRSYQLQDHRSSIVFHDDMDTSESEHSDVDDDDDDEWVNSEKRPAKKRNSKVKRSQVIGNSDSDEKPTAQQASRLCCSCSKWSSCKTSKCECKAAGGSCGTHCGCETSKCTNRELIIISDSPIQGATNSDKNATDLASQGAMLLQSAMSEKPPQTHNDGDKGRKPLSDIGNTGVCYHILQFIFISFHVACHATSYLSLDLDGEIYRCHYCLSN